MGLLYYVSYFAVLAAFGFITLSLASGLLYVSELIEEHSRLAKQIGQRGIYVRLHLPPQFLRFDGILSILQAIILLHIIFYFSDSLPFLQTMFSITCHIVYLQNFSHTWPLISLSSPTFLGSCALVIADHFIWFFYFSRITHEARYSRAYRGGGPKAPGFTEIASFFGICVWLAPLFLFLSLSANDNALPTSSEPGSPSTSFSSPTATTRISLFRSIFSFLPFFKAKSRQDRNGIIAARSQIARAPLPSQHTPPPASPLMPTAPPRSPAPRSPGFNRSQNMGGQELEIPAPTSSTSFRLGAPPVTKRSVQSERLSGNALGSGTWRSTQSSQDR
ncbi:Protein SVP26 [Leucoagaricus sp. SymC.cos]|nr:Protein SVP26 [Leucoagaricus sp. SymC.cos]